MIEKLNEILRGLIKRTKDTGWIDLTPSTENVIWTVAGKLRVRRIGNHVHLSVLNLRTESEINREIMVIKKLPNNFVPESNLIFPVVSHPNTGYQFGGILQVGTDGNVLLSEGGTTPYVPTYGIFAEVEYFVGGGATANLIIGRLFAPVRGCAA